MQYYHRLSDFVSHVLVKLDLFNAWLVYFTCESYNQNLFKWIQIIDRLQNIKC